MVERLTLAGLLLLAFPALAAPPAELGRDFFAAHCTACHGADGRGGPGAAGLGRSVPDLTTIRARRGGSFDRDAVMSTIDGYLRRQDKGHPMPEFGALLDGRTVLAETAPGVFTPTPEVLVGLADYLESLQR